MRYIMVLLGGVALTYLYNFIRYFNPGDSDSNVGPYMADAIYQ